MNTSYTIPSSKQDDDLLASVSKQVFEDIFTKYLLDSRFPDNWNFDISGAKLAFKEIAHKFIEIGISPEKVKQYYGLSNCIITDSNIIYLTIKNGGTVKKYPIFLGEIKKQGTNDVRLLNKLSPQAIGNAAPDRIAKNYLIVADYCYACNNNLFPYNVFLHGCDFDENITSTTKSKLTPFFGELNKLNPYFDKDFKSLKGGSCYYQKNPFTFEQLYKYCYNCCIECIEYYINNM